MSKGITCQAGAAWRRLDDQVGTGIRMRQEHPRENGASFKGHGGISMREGCFLDRGFLESPCH